MHIFKTSFIQVFLVACNTIFLSNGNILGIAMMSFLISWFWVSNVKKAAVSNKIERIVYCTGAMCGGVSGYYFTLHLQSFTYFF